MMVLILPEFAPDSVLRIDPGGLVELCVKQRIEPQLTLCKARPYYCSNPPRTFFSVNIFLSVRNYTCYLKFIF